MELDRLLEGLMLLLIYNEEQELPVSNTQTFELVGCMRSGRM